MMMKNNSNTQKKSIIFGGGCFLSMDAIFQELKGVIQVTSGYSGGGHSKQISHELLRKGLLGNAEVVHVEYNSDEISFVELVTIFLTTHNPTVCNQQGNDIGTQYRSIIFYENLNDKAIIDILIKQLQPLYGKPILTEVKEKQRFYKAENCYQSFYSKRRRFGYCTSMFEPQLNTFRKMYSHKLKSAS